MMYIHVCCGQGKGRWQKLKKTITEQNLEELATEIMLHIARAVICDQLIVHPYYISMFHSLAVTAISFM